jgi:hypothetical protein
MTRIQGRALDPETLAPIARRLVYATLHPTNAVLPVIGTPPGVDRTFTDSNGDWELNLRRSAGYAAHYVVRVWLHKTYRIDVPAEPGPYQVESLLTDEPDGDAENPPSWGLPDYVKRNELGIPSGVATLNADGILTEAQRPPSNGGGGPSGPLSYQYTQIEPSTVWLITHGLSFVPSGIEVVDHMGVRQYPDITHPSNTAVQLGFDTDVRGTARLS